MTAFTTGVVRVELLRRVLVGILCILYQTARQFKPAVGMMQLKIAFAGGFCYNVRTWHIWSLSM
jgi:hypothetical protein